jgi:large conductance mechanosensitive channel
MMKIKRLKIKDTKVTRFFDEFKDFASKGNVIDLAVGVVIGTAFTNIVKALVDSIIMPLLSIIIGRIDISKLAFTIKPAIPGMATITLPYGGFLQALLNFLLISFSIFLMIKLLDKLHKKEPEKPAVAEITHSEELLTEIRDLLKQSKQGSDENLR